MKTFFHQFLKFLRFPLRIAAMIPILMSLLWDYQTFEGLMAAVIGGALGVVVGEIVGNSKLRKRAIIIFAIFGCFLFHFLAKKLTYYSWPSELLGPTKVLRLHALIQGGGFCFSIVGSLRALALRSNVFFALEFWLMAFACAFAFAPHRDGAEMSPMWLNDYAWENGYEPHLILGVVGGVLAFTLMVLTLLEKAKRLPVATVLLPLFVIGVFFYLDPSKVGSDEPPENELEKLMEELYAQGDQESSGGGQGGSGSNEDSLQQPDPQQSSTSQGKSLPVAVVLLKNDFTPPSDYFYLRQENLSEFNGIRLGQVMDRNIPYDNFRGFPAREDTIPLAAPPYDRQTVKGEVRLLAYHTSPFGIESIVKYAPAVNPRPTTFVRSYAFESSAVAIDYEDMFTYTAGNSEWSDAEWEHYLKTPDDPRYKALAEEIKATLPPEYQDNAFAKAVKVKLYLDDNTKYTQRIDHSWASDPTASYLFGPQNQFIGYCVHTAHAAAFLWRELGIPSRIGVGYAVEGDRIRGDGIVVNNGDAHAWPELYLDEVGWVALDISPGENLDEESPLADEDRMDSLIELARDVENTTFRQPIDWTAFWAKWRPIITLWSKLILMFILAVHYGFKIYRQIRIFWKTTPLFLYIASIDKLSQVGVRRLYGESRESFAKRLSSSLPSFAIITNGHLEDFFSNNSVNANTLQTAYTQFNSELQQTVPWWRRVLGVLNPFSFYGSK